MGAYGYARPTTPNLDCLAASGVVFEAAYSPTPHTSYAVTSITTGKYMRPLVLQGLGEDSETWAGHLRRLRLPHRGLDPPAVFFIDAERFGTFRDRALDFEYRKVEFAPAASRATQVKAYLDKVKPDRRVFLWGTSSSPTSPTRRTRRTRSGTGTWIATTRRSPPPTRGSARLSTRCARCVQARW